MVRSRTIQSSLERIIRITIARHQSGDEAQVHLWITVAQGVQFIFEK